MSSPNGADPNVAGHVVPGEWQSFEMRMRRRRAERLIARAQTALAAGNTDEVREVLEEARNLTPDLPQILALEEALNERAVVANVAPPRPITSSPTIDSRIDLEFASIPVGPAERQPRSHRLGYVAAAILLMSGIGAAAFWIVRHAPNDEFASPAPVYSYTSGTSPMLRDLLTPTYKPASGATDSSATADSPSARVTIETVEAAAVAIFGESPEVPPPPVQPRFPELQPKALAAVDARAPSTAELVSTSGSLAAPPRDSRELTASARDSRELTTIRSVPRDFLVPTSNASETVTALPSLTTEPTLEVRNSVAPAPAPEFKPATSGVARAVDALAGAPPQRMPDDIAVRGVLTKYAAAYNRLDAAAAQQIWPAVNRAALSRAFDNLASQEVSLDLCAVDVRGATARATCAGSATWAPKVGNSAPRTEARNWTFQLEKAGGDWQIVSARVQNR